MHSLSLIFSPPPGRHIENALYCSIVGKLNTNSLVQVICTGAGNLRSGVIFLFFLFASLLLWLEREKNNA